MPTRIKIIVVAVACVLCLLFFIYPFYQTIYVSQTYPITVDKQRYNGDFDSVIHAIGQPDLEFVSYATYKYGEEVVALESADLTVRILSIPTSTSAEAVFALSSSAKKHGLFMNLLKFPRGETRYRPRSESFSEAPIDQMFISYQATSYEKILQYGDHHYLLKGMEFVSLDLDRANLLDINFKVPTDTEVFWLEVSGELYVAFLCHKR